MTTEFYKHFLDFSHSGEGLSGFDQLYEEYHHAVYANILKMVRQPAIAEDLLQDVFVALWENHPKIERNRVGNWLFVVSYNKSVNFLKKVRKEKLEFLHEQQNLSVSSHWDTVSEEEFEWKLQLIEEAIDQLPLQKRIVFAKYRLEGKSLNEIAEELRISVNTVKDHLKIANKLVRAYVADKYPLSSGAELVIWLSFLVV